MAWYKIYDDYAFLGSIRYDDLSRGLYCSKCKLVSFYMTVGDDIKKNSDLLCFEKDENLPQVCDKCNIENLNIKFHPIVGWYLGSNILFFFVKHKRMFKEMSPRYSSSEKRFVPGVLCKECGLLTAKVTAKWFLEKDNVSELKKELGINDEKPLW
jgi:hypothetical protein